MPASLSEPTAEPAWWVVHCDGSALPNPGHMGLGATLAAPDGTRHTLSVATHAVGCNNEAELRALVAALQALRGHGAEAVQAYTDSSTLVAQLGPAPARPIARLESLFAEARALLGTFPHARVAWIPAHRNTEADALARAALGITAPRAAPAPRHRKRRRR